MIGNCYNCPAAVCSVTVWDTVRRKKKEGYGGTHEGCFYAGTMCAIRGAPNEIQESIYQVNYYLSGNFFTTIDHKYCDAGESGRVHSGEYLRQRSFQYGSHHGYAG